MIHLHSLARLHEKHPNDCVPDVVSHFAIDTALAKRPR
jgi:hypothetical protein